MFDLLDVKRFYSLVELAKSNVWLRKCTDLSFLSSYRCYPYNYSVAECRLHFF